MKPHIIQFFCNHLSLVFIYLSFKLTTKIKYFTNISHFTNNYYLNKATILIRII